MREEFLLAKEKGYLKNNWLDNDEKKEISEMIENTENYYKITSHNL